MHNNDNTTTKPTGHRFARYRVTPSNVGCDLWLADGYHGDPVTDGPVTLHFWAPTDGGYAYEELPGRPGTLGRQVCETLFGLGSTLWCSRDALPDAIRRRARQHCDAIDREAAGARL